MASINYVDQCADLVGTVAGPFAITSGSNDKLDITIDGGSVQHITLTAGAARTTAQVVADINATLTGAVAYANNTWTNHPQPGRVRIQTTSTNGASSTILIGAPSNNANATLGFTAGTTTGYPRVNATWTSVLNTKQELINQIETQLLAVGWTTVSGHATTNLLMQSALSPPGQELQMRLRVKDNAGSCATLSIENVAGSVAGGNSTTNGVYLIPNTSKVWRFLGNKYQFWIHPAQPYGYGVTNHGRGCAGFGLGYVPSFLQGTATEVIWLTGSARSDTDSNTSQPDLFAFLGHGSANNFGGTWTNNHQAIYNGALVDAAGVGSAGAFLSLMAATCGSVWAWGGTPQFFQWVDGSGNLLTAILGWGSPAFSSVGQWRCQLWDAFISTVAYAGDQSITFDSHPYVAITDNNTGYQASPDYVFEGTLFVAVG